MVGIVQAAKRFEKLGYFPNVPFRSQTVFF
jgi:hypothetical protein